MLKLINIKINDELISANYIPENSQEMGFVEVSLKDGSITKKIETAFEGDYSEYPSMAKRGLLRVAKMETIPEFYRVACF